jgi:hypothetical protein
VIPQVRETTRSDLRPAILRVPRASLDALGEIKIRIEARGATGDRSAGALRSCAGRDMRDVSSGIGRCDGGCRREVANCAQFGSRSLACVDLQAGEARGCSNSAGVRACLPR